MQSIAAEELKQRVNDVFILDVRTDEEYRDWHMPQSMHVPLPQLMQRAHELPRDKEIITVCAHGNRSQLAAQFLNGLQFRVRSLEGGMAAWNNVYDNAAIGSGFQVRRVGKGCVSYVIASNGVAAVIDPSRHTQHYLDLAHAHGLAIAHVLDTHQHADHLSGARLLAIATGAALYLNELDSYHVQDFTPLRDGAAIAVGNATIEALHTPGHTKGSMSFITGNALITGDTLFVNGIGRPDLHGKTEEYAAELFATYHDRMSSVPDRLSVMPGHVSGIALAFGEAVSSPLKEVRQLPQLQLPRQEFIDYLKTHVPAAPNNYDTIRRINSGELQLYEDEADELEEGPNRCTVR